MEVIIKENQTRSIEKFLTNQEFITTKNEECAVAPEIVKIKINRESVFFGPQKNIRIFNNAKCILKNESDKDFDAVHVNEVGTNVITFLTEKQKFEKEVRGLVLTKDKIMFF